MPLALQITLQAFKKWVVDFVGSISPPGKRTGACYIITVTDYLTRRDEAAPVKECTAMTAAKFLFENVFIRFDFRNILLSDQGMHFVNKVIAELTVEI